MKFSSLLLGVPFLVRIHAAECPRASVSGNAITGFRYFNDCTTWTWRSRDKGTTVTLSPDCILRQAWPNPQNVWAVCIRLEGGEYQCFQTGANGAECSVPSPWCSTTAKIANMWGW
uniref:Effector protein n=1 Tax=Fusarium oxysporum f. sp. apii TaxID=224912 RepID=A0A866WJ41_FUSOX|nr:effector protein [Fusarium oxysporum f. sp. apii]